MDIKQSFAPVVAPSTRVLILGSLPSDASLAAAQYYAHPRNQFWPLIGNVLNLPDFAALPYPTRLEQLLTHGIGLWDIVAQAHRAGSLDNAIRHVERNDLAQLIAHLPELRGVAFNGQTAARAAREVEQIGLPWLALPSSSPAYTRPFVEKREQWVLLRPWLGE